LEEVWWGEELVSRSKKAPSEREHLTRNKVIYGEKSSSTRGKMERGLDLVFIVGGWAIRSGGGTSDIIEKKTLIVSN